MCRFVSAEFSGEESRCGTRSSHRPVAFRVTGCRERLLDSAGQVARPSCALVTIVGQAALISAGEWVTATGDWVDDQRQQFRARLARTSRAFFGIAAVTGRYGESLPTQLHGLRGIQVRTVGHGTKAKKTLEALKRF
jgi:hypothetical protein